MGCTTNFAPNSPKSTLRFSREWLPRMQLHQHSGLDMDGSLQWRHNDHDGVSNHQPHGCLLNRLYRRTSMKTPKLRVTGLCAGNSPGPVNSPHKGPVTRKMCPFDYVIMCYLQKSISKNYHRDHLYSANDRSAAAAENHCRSHTHNTDNSLGPWCYQLDNVYEFCDVPWCIVTGKTRTWISNYIRSFFFH